MNILMISPFDLVVERLWGPTVRLHSLAKELNSLGHNVVLAGPPPFKHETPSMLDGVKLHYFHKPFHRYGYSNDGGEEERGRINSKKRLPSVLISRFLEINKLISKFKIDVLYLNRAFPDTAYPAFGAHFFKRIPIIYDWDDLEGLHGFSTSFRHKLSVQLLETLNEVVFARLAAATVVASQYLYEFALNIGVPENRLFYAPTVADSKVFSSDIDGSNIRKKFGLKNRKVLLYCGNLYEGNGVKVEGILYTLKSLLKKDSSFCLLVIGDGDLLVKNGGKGKLVELAENLGLSGNVIFTGGIPYIEIPTYIAAADICLALFPLNLITMCKSPLKVYEYMAIGKPVVARAVGEISRCIEDGKSGILVYSDNPEEYSEKILSAFTSSDYLSNLGRYAREAIDQKFNWNKSADIVIQACKKTIKKIKQ